MAREYPPINHINYANAILLGGHKFIPLGIFKAITSFLVFLGSYLLIRALLSQTVAIIAAFGMLFSNRAFSTFLYGQHPTTLSFIFIPLILYVHYKLIVNLMQKKDFSKYLIILILLLTSQFLLHLQGLLISIILILSTSFLFLVFLLFKKQGYKLKALISKNNIKLYVLLIILGLIITLPFFSIYFGRISDETTSERDYSRIFQWGVDPEAGAGAYPASFISFQNEYSYLFLIFLIIGVIFALIKYKLSNYLFLLGCLLGTYVVLHSDILLGFSIIRIVRMLIFESYILWIFIAIGISLLISLIISLSKSVLSKDKRVYLRYALILFVLVIIYFNLASPIKVNAEQVYPEIIRVNSDELLAADWIKDNLPLESHIFVKNDHIQWRFYKYRFIRTMAHRPAYQEDNISQAIFDWNAKYDKANQDYGTNLPLITHRYLLIDYSDYVKLASDPQYQGVINQFKQYEKYYFENISPLYNNKNIVIYNITNMTIY